jgi:hypothetical protein
MHVCVVSKYSGDSCQINGTDAAAAAAGRADSIQGGRASAAVPRAIDHISINLSLLAENDWHIRFWLWLRKRAKANFPMANRSLTKGGLLFVCFS